MDSARKRVKIWFKGGNPLEWQRINLDQRDIKICPDDGTVVVGPKSDIFGADLTSIAAHGGWYIPGHAIQLVEVYEDEPAEEV